MDKFNAKVFLDEKQEEHYKKFGVYADTNSKIAEWMEEYHKIELEKIIQKNLTIV